MEGLGVLAQGPTPAPHPTQAQDRSLGLDPYPRHVGANTTPIPPSGPLDARYAVTNPRFLCDNCHLGPLAGRLAGGFVHRAMAHALPVNRYPLSLSGNIPGTWFCFSCLVDQTVQAAAEAGFACERQRAFTSVFARLHPSRDRDAEGEMDLPTPPPAWAGADAPYP